MSGIGSARRRPVDAAGLTLGIVATRWHAELVDQMLDRAVEAAKACGVDDADVVPGAGLGRAAGRRPGAGRAARRGGRPRRGRPRRHAHFDYVCHSVTEGLTRVALDAGTPVGTAC